MVVLHARNMRNNMFLLSSTHLNVSNTFTIDTHKEGEHTNVSKVHLVCRIRTLCVALGPYVSLTRFGECAVTRIHWVYDGSVCSCPWRCRTNLG